MENNNIIENQEQNQEPVTTTIVTDKNSYDTDDISVKTNGFNWCSSVTVVAIGQAGSIVGTMLEKRLKQIKEKNNVLILNSAQADLDSIDIPDKFKYLISQEGSGAGKKREYAKNAFWGDNNQNDLFEKIIESNKHKFFGQNKIVLVVFSTGGGTGSAIGPKFTAKLTQYCSNLQEEYVVNTRPDGTPITDKIDNYRPNVIGLCLSPDFKSNTDSGVDTLSNSLECFKEIDILIKNKLASFFIFNNKINEESTNGLFTDFNNEIVNGFERFIKKIGFSNTGGTILDMKDRFVALSNPGLMAFYDLSNNYSYGSMLPVKGSTILNVAAELTFDNMETQKNKLNKIKNWLSNYIVSDQTIGWSDINMVSEKDSKDEIRKRDIILLSGFNNISSLLENMKDTLERKLENMKNKELSGSAFSSLASIQEDRNSNKKKTDVDIDKLI